MLSPATTVSCNPPAFAAGASTSCTATVTDSVATPPFATGTVNFFADASTTAFASCSLTGTGQVQTCAVSYTTTTVGPDRKSTRLNSSHDHISYSVFCS